MIRSSPIAIFAENINAQIAGNGISGVLVLKIFWGGEGGGGMPPYPPKKSYVRRASINDQAFVTQCDTTVNDTFAYFEYKDNL